MTFITAEFDMFETEIKLSFEEDYDWVQISFSKSNLIFI